MGESRANHDRVLSTVQRRKRRDTVSAREGKADLKAKRDAIRLLAKQKRFWAVAHVQTLPVQTQKQINRAYKAARLTGGTNLSYARWCAELFREADDPSQYPGAIQQAVREWDAAATNAAPPSSTPARP